MPIPEELELQQAVYPVSCSKGAAVTPDDGRKFAELYNVQHLQSSQLDKVSRVCISTIQRLYSMLRYLFFGFKHRYHRISSREETGSASYPFNEACRMVSVVANACGPLLGDALRWT